MSIKTVGRKIDSSASQAIQTLPKDLEKVIGKVNIHVIDFFANIKAIFKIIFFGPWKNFNGNIDLAKLDIANRDKLRLYENLKYKNSKPHEKALRGLTGYEVGSQDKIVSLKKSPKDFKVYQIFETTISEKDYNKIKDLLEKVENENGSNYYAVLVSLQDLVKDKKVPDEIKNIIIEKLNKIPKRAQKNIKYLPQNPELATYSMWKKVAIGTMALAGVTLLGAATYEAYLYFGKIAILPSQITQKDDAQQSQITDQYSETKSSLEQLFYPTCKLDVSSKQATVQQGSFNNILLDNNTLLKSIGLTKYCFDNNSTRYSEVIMRPPSATNKSTKYSSSNLKNNPFSSFFVSSTEIQEQDCNNVKSIKSDYNSSLLQDSQKIGDFNVFNILKLAKKAIGKGVKSVYETGEWVYKTTVEMNNQNLEFHKEKSLPLLFNLPSKK